MDPVLAQAFGTYELVKVAEGAAPKWEPMKGGLPLAALVGGMLLLHGARKGVGNDVNAAHARAAAVQNTEVGRLAGTASALRGGAPLDPMAGALYQSERADSSSPGDLSMFDKGAAAHGVRAGRALAKSAGIGSLAMKGLGALNKAPNALVSGAQKLVKPVVGAMPSLSLGQKALVGGAALGTGLLAAKAGKKAVSFGMEPAEPKVEGGPAAPMPSYVNQYGVPTLG